MLWRHTGFDTDFWCLRFLTRSRERPEPKPGAFQSETIPNHTHKKKRSKSFVFIPAWNISGKSKVSWHWSFTLWPILAKKICSRELILSEMSLFCKYWGSSVCACAYKFNLYCLWFCLAAVFCSLLLWSYCGSAAKDRVKEEQQQSPPRSG